MKTVEEILRDELLEDILTIIEQKEELRYLKKYIIAATEKHAEQFKLKQPKVIQSFPDWYKELSLLELQMQELKYDMPKNLIERRGYVTDLETFDMKLTAMQNRLHRAFEELKGNVV